VRFVQELEAQDGAYFQKWEAVGTLAHFVRTTTPFPSQ
jgi:hypothetical protein